MLFAADHHAMSQPLLSTMHPALRTDGVSWRTTRRLAVKAAVRMLAIGTVVLALTAPAWADISRDQAAAAAQRQTGGRVLSVDKAESGRRTMWRVKLVTPRGEVRVVFIDAESDRGG